MFFFVLCAYCNVELFYYCITQLCSAIRPFARKSVNEITLIVIVELVEITIRHDNGLPKIALFNAVQTGSLCTGFSW